MFTLGWGWGEGADYKTVCAHGSLKKKSNKTQSSDVPKNQNISRGVGCIRGLGVISTLLFFLFLFTFFFFTFGSQSQVQEKLKRDHSVFRSLPAPT